MGLGNRFKAGEDNRCPFEGISSLTSSNPLAQIHYSEKTSLTNSLWSNSLSLSVCHFVHKNHSWSEPPERPGMNQLTWYPVALALGCDREIY